jgi:hypothetical protein
VRCGRGVFPTASDIPDLRLPPPLDPDRALFLDVDGTLLEIAPRPANVFVPSELPILLKQERNIGAAIEWTAADQRQGTVPLSRQILRRSRPHR